MEMRRLYFDVWTDFLDTTYVGFVTIKCTTQPIIVSITS
jgi:hypothetical protein